MLCLLQRHYSTLTIGSGFSKRVFLIDGDGQRVSFWHDVPLKAGPETFHVGIEIPRYHLSKMEVTLDEQHNPIKQDTRRNRHTTQQELRMYAQFPYFQYGFFPQTWENPIQKESRLLQGMEGVQGDNDPLDAVELGTRQYEVGQVIQAKVLGSLCLIDQGEIDWKVFTIDVEEAQQKGIHSLDDVETQSPGRLAAIQNWFRNIKTYDGKAPNSIYMDRLFTVEQTMQVINDNHKEWLEHKSTT